MALERTNPTQNLFTFDLKSQLQIKRVVLVSELLARNESTLLLRSFAPGQIVCTSYAFIVGCQ